MVHNLLLLSLAVPVVAEMSSILQVGVGQEAAELAVLAADVLVVSLLLEALLRTRLEARRGSQISMTCPSMFPIVPGMGDRPSHHC